MINPPCYSTTLFSAQIGVDTTAPKVPTILSPTATTYTVNQAVPSSYTCADPDGVVDPPTCVGPVGNIDTSAAAVGSSPHTFMVTATDRAGNKTTNSVTYSVAYPNAFHLLFKIGSGKVKTGNNLTYGVFLVNFGPGAAYGVNLQDVVPAGTSFVSAVFQGTNCPVNLRIVTCTIGTLPPFSAVGVKLVVNVTAPAGSTITNFATVAGLNPDPHTGNTTSNTVRTKVVAP